MFAKIITIFVVTSLINQSVLTLDGCAIGSCFVCNKIEDNKTCTACYNSIRTPFESDKTIFYCKKGTIKNCIHYHDEDNTKNKGC
jgi:hypothetical protein